MGRDVEPKYGYQGLFFAILLMTIIDPFLYGFWQGVIIQAFFTVVLLSALYTLSFSRKFFKYALFLAVPAVIFHWYVYFIPNYWVKILALISAISFMAIVIFSLSRQIFLHETFNLDKIFGAICIYFTIAIFFSLVYQLMYFLDRNAFAGIETIIPNLGDVGGEEDKEMEIFMYFSLVTISTLGYGDITPIASYARTFAAVEAVIGQFYLATLVAGLIGMILHLNVKKRELDTK